jgi:hypothetical protein
MFRRGHITGDHRNAILRRGPGNLEQGLAAARHKRRLFQQVGWRIAADGELGKKHQVRATLLRSTGKFEDFCGISAEIANGGIDLSERNLHSFSVAIERLPSGCSVDRRISSA